MNANSQTTTPPSSQTAKESDSFAVDRILVTELPPELGTVDAPDRYTVTAVFTRRPLPQELELLVAPAVDTALAKAGYAHVTLRPADRRLLIGNTNLNELEHGLASAIGAILDDIGAAAATTRSAQARDAAEFASRAAERANRVLEEVERIDFSPHHSQYS
ncbi:hypothetical protein [Agromyces binzhouensis]|uniref:Uncharacterized protein n=1 Tax=Agromyces binzhouensis TaxID=1817495 RepID=A0A4Q2JNS7_9MICO|nr:hypothetical protein [Agromyces binzhouensis]RXZ48319.1 hypothetical protein ESO86_07065 [Agromyces binzhouensis]